MYILNNKNKPVFFLTSDIQEGSIAELCENITSAVNSGFDKIILSINSLGGSVIDALSLCNVIAQAKESGVIVETQILGTAQSSASLVAIMGSKGYRAIMQHSSIMIHDPYLDSEQLGEEQKKIIEDSKRQIAWMMATYTGVEIDKIYQLMSETTYLNADEAIALGFCDKKITPIAKAMEIEKINENKEVKSKTQYKMDKEELDKKIGEIEAKYRQEMESIKMQLDAIMAAKDEEISALVASLIDSGEADKEDEAMMKTIGKSSGSAEVLAYVRRIKPKKQALEPKFSHDVKSKGGLSRFAEEREESLLDAFKHASKEEKIEFLKNNPKAFAKALLKQ